MLCGSIQNLLINLRKHNQPNDTFGIISNLFRGIKTIEEVIEEINPVTADNILKLPNELLNKEDFPLFLLIQKIF